MKPGNTHLPSDCPAISDVLSRVGDKWSVLVVSKLGSGTKRFNELRREIGGISQRMLTLTLRGLERDGLVNRTIVPTSPPGVQYDLTALGCDLLQPVSALSAWAVRNQPKIAQARTKFDGAERSATPAPAKGERKAAVLNRDGHRASSYAK
jgi:DNA-binding HxlR family transcriptional regulator